MCFRQIFDDLFYSCFYFEKPDKSIIIASANTTFENKANEKKDIDFINQYLDIIQYEISSKVVKVVFFKKRYLELFKIEDNNSFVKFEIPYIINIHIFYDNYQKYSKMQFKIIGFTQYNLEIIPIPNKDFIHIVNYEGYEIVKISDYEERKKEIERKKNYFESLRRGYPQ